MKEVNRITKLLQDLYNGSPWIDVNISAVLENISANQAGKKISPQWNTIWEIINHIISWRQNVLQRLHGKEMVSPENNYLNPVKDQSEAAWKATLRELDQSQEHWIAFLREFDQNNFDKICHSNNMNYYEHIHGIIQHDAYHLGQVVLLAKSQDDS